MKAYLLIAAAAWALAACDNSGSASKAGIDVAETEKAGAPQFGQAPPQQMLPQQGKQMQPQSVRPPPTGALPPGAIRLQPTQIIDPNGFERPMVAATVLVPAGWQTQGGVVWNVQATCGSGYQFNWSAAAQDGSSGVALIPGTSWAATNFGAPAQPGCPNIQAANVGDYLRWLVGTNRPGAQVLDFRLRPDLLEGFEQLNQTTPMPMGEMRTWVEAGEILLAYSFNGMEKRETIAAIIVFTESRMQDAMGGVMATMSAASLPAYAFHAPAGQLDFKLAETIRASIQTDPQWQARINKSNAEIAAVANREARKRSDAIAQTGDEIRQMMSDSWQERNRIMDRSHRETIETIRGVETYDDPMSTTGQVELSNQYNNAWRLNDGSYVLTDDPSFNPYAATGQDGTRLEPTR